MPFDTVAHHEAELCINIPRPCVHACGELIFPPSVKERHEWYLCQQRPVECRLRCGIPGLVFATREAHEGNVCPNRIKHCALGCGAPFPAHGEKEHEAQGEWSVCPARPVRCHFGKSQQSLRGVGPPVMLPSKFQLEGPPYSHVNFRGLWISACGDTTQELHLVRAFRLCCSPLPDGACRLPGEATPNFAGHAP